MIYVLINAALSNYPHQFKCLKDDMMFTVMPLSFYFIAKTTRNNIDVYIEKMIIPMLIAMSIGVILYVVNPPWYTAAKYAILASGYGYTSGIAPDEIMKEVFELSSIWKTSYVIGYSNSFFILFILIQLLSGKICGKKKIYYLILFTLSVSVLILSGFRSIMLGFVLSLLAIFCLSDNKKAKIKIFWWGGVLILATAYVMLSISPDYYEIFTKGFSDLSSETGLLSRFEFVSKGIQLDTEFGDGFGHHGMGMKNINNDMFIEDSQFIKILAELGYVGLFLFIIFIVIAGITALRANCVLELCILITFTVTFIGASSLSAETTFPFIFWYTIGCISRKASRIHKNVSVPQRGGKLILQNN